MNKRTYLLTIGLCLFTLTASAQYNGGIKAGVSFPRRHVSGNPMLSDSTQRQTFGYHAGGEFLMQLPVVGLEFEVDLLFVKKSYSYASNKVNPRFEFTRAIYYLDLPLKLNYSIGLATTGLFVGAGPTLSVGLFAKDSGPSATSARPGFGGKPTQLNRFDVSLSAQLGLRFSGVQLSGYFDWGFLDCENIPSETSTLYHGGISLGYLF